MSNRATHPPAPWLRVLMRRNVLAGLMFVTIAALGLWISREYPVGTALRMGTGYVPRLLCWLLLFLGIVIAVQGFVEKGVRQDDPIGLAGWRAVVTVTLSLTAFGLTIETLGLVVSIALLIGFAALAGRGLRLVETVFAAVLLIALSWGIFIVGLGITIPVWPEW